jgi:hypothetical protein
MAHGAWRMAHGAWRMAHGAWRMAHGAWRMAHGAWRWFDGQILFRIHFGVFRFCQDNITARFEADKAANR